MKAIKLTIIPAFALLLFVFTGCGQKKNPAASETRQTTEATEAQAAEPVTSEPDEGSKGKPLGIKSGIIEYTYSGDKTGKSIQYFDDYGMKNAVYVETSAQGEESKSWTVTIGEDQYMWDPSDPGQGMKTRNPMMKMLTEAAGKDMLSYMAGMYEQMGMKESGTEMFQGKDCTVFKGDMGKVLIWKGIMMMMEMKIGTMVTRQEVTSLKTNIHVDGKYFRIPDNTTFSEIPGL